MDYPVPSFGDSFSRFGFIVRTDRITEAHQRYILTPLYSRRE